MQRIQALGLAQIARLSRSSVLGLGLQRSEASG